MVTRETEIGGYKVSETRPRHHWWILDFLGFFLVLSVNSWITLPKMFEFFYNRYIKFIVYSREYSIITEKKIENYKNPNPEYSTLFKDALAKLEESVSKDMLN